MTSLLIGGRCWPHKASLYGNYVYGTDKYNRLMNYYGQSCKDTEKATLSSMREVENAANMFYYTEE